MILYALCCLIWLRLKERKERRQRGSISSIKTLSTIRSRKCWQLWCLWVKIEAQLQDRPSKMKRIIWHGDLRLNACSYSSPMRKVVLISIERVNSSSIMSLTRLSLRLWTRRRSLKSKTSLWHSIMCQVKNRTITACRRKIAGSTRVRLVRKVN